MPEQPTSTPKMVVARVKKAVDYVAKKLDIKYTIGVYPINSKIGDENTADTEEALLEVCRSNRGQQDKSAFLIFVNTKELSKLTANEIRRHVFHEICHIITWEYTDEMENFLKKIEDGPLKEELLERMFNTREDVTYRMERTFGPHVLPNIDWTVP